MITPEQDKDIKTWGERLRAIQGIFWAIGLIIAGLGWYIQYSKTEALKGAVTVEIFDKYKKETKREMKALLDTAFAEERLLNKAKAEKFIREYVSPMMDTDDELKLQMSRQTNTLQVIVSSSTAFSNETRSKLRARAESDSLKAENERLKSRLKVQERAESIIEEVTDDALQLKEKRRKQRRERDEIE